MLRGTRRSTAVTMGSNPHALAALARYSASAGSSSISSSRGCGINSSLPFGGLGSNNAPDKISQRLFNRVFDKVPIWRSQRRSEAIFGMFADIIRRKFSGQALTSSDAGVRVDDGVAVDGGATASRTAGRRAAVGHAPRGQAHQCGRQRTVGEDQEPVRWRRDGNRAARAAGRRRGEDRALLAANPRDRGVDP